LVIAETVIEEAKEEHNEWEESEPPRFDKEEHDLWVEQEPVVPTVEEAVEDFHYEEEVHEWESEEPSTFQVEEHREWEQEEPALDDYVHEEVPLEGLPPVEEIPAEVVVDVAPAAVESIVEDAEPEVVEAAVEVVAVAEEEHTEWEDSEPSKFDTEAY